MKLITKCDNANFNNLYSVAIIICIDQTCYCSRGLKTKLNIISNDKSPFSQDCPHTVTRVCYRGKCYCQQHQNIQKKRAVENFKEFSNTTIVESSASASWYNNFKSYFLLAILVVFISFLV